MIDQRPARVLALIALACAALAARSRPAQAFPGMIRYGYVNCTSCHVSPTGGGVLTAYGRELSQEALSSWSAEGEGRFAYGAFADKLPEALHPGGDVRALQYYVNNPVYTEKRFFLMQAELEVAYDLGPFTLDVAGGYYDATVDSPRHYVLYHATDELSVRFGKFHAAYGLNLPEHIASTRQFLGFDQGTETYNLEGSWLTDRFNLYLTALFGKPESQDGEHGLTIGQVGVAEYGGSARGSVFLGGTSELGLEFYYGQNASGGREVFGPFTTISFSKRVYLLGEADLQYKNGAWGPYDYLRFTVEPWQGVQLFATQEYADPVDYDPSQRMERYGLGFQLFPRPHFEFEGFWGVMRAQPDPTTFGQFAWLLLHYYL